MSRLVRVLTITASLWCWQSALTQTSLVQSGGDTVAESASSTSGSRADLQQQFASVITLLDTGKYGQAIALLERLIAAYPEVPELYLNLAAAHAAAGSLDQARQALIRAIEYQESYKALYSSLQTVLSAQAADAFKKALDATEPTAPAKAVSLPLARSLKPVDRAQREPSALEKEPSASEKEPSALDNEPSAPREESPPLIALQTTIASLKAELADAGARIDRLQRTHSNAIDQLQQEVADTSALLGRAQAAERDAIARAVKAEQALDNQQTQLAEQLTQSHQRALADKNAVIARQAEQLAKLQETPANDVMEPNLQQEVASQSTPLTDELPATSLTQPNDIKRIETSVEQNESTQQLIGLVKRWANSWSAMDVDGYVSHYASEYSPARSVSHQAWLKQRRERLTRHDFINVTVDDFSVEIMGAEMAVTFTQHYRSESFDEVIRKRLVFSADDDNWSNAKIVKELRVQG